MAITDKKKGALIAWAAIGLSVTLFGFAGASLFCPQPAFAALYYLNFKTGISLFLEINKHETKKPWLGEA